MSGKPMNDAKSGPMNRSQWLELEPHVDRVLELPADQRHDYFANLRQRDAALAAEVERFVAESERPDPRIDVSAPEQFAALFDDHLPAPLAPNTLLADRYLIQHEIGRGGMAIVYLASDLKLNHASVAVKVMRRGSLTKREERFDEEIRLTSRLRHPNIVQLSDRGEFADHLFFVMPYVEGETLRARLEREQASRLSIPEALRIGIDIARALDYAHNHNVIHRDVKPSNLLLTNGVAMLADFGIARSAATTDGAADTDPITDVGVRLGTPQYMSPEQCDGSESVDSQTDIYSLGCVLYEMIAGVRPTQAVRRLAESFRGSDPVRPLRERRGAGDVSPALEACVMSALAMRKADRTRRAVDLERALERCAREYGVAVTPWRRLYWRAPRVVVATVTAGVILLAVSAIWLIRHVAPVGEAEQNAPPVRLAGEMLDTTRIVVMPFAHTRAAKSSNDEDDRLRDALKRWDGIDAVDRLETRDAFANRDTAHLTATVARDIARALRAPRYIRGEVSASGDSSIIRAGLYDARTGVALTSALVTMRRTLSDSALAALGEQLLFPDVPESTMVRLRSATRSRPALQAYARSQAAIAAWDLPRADTGLTTATNYDPRFALAYLWLAQVRSWRGMDTATWQFAAHRASAARASLGSRDRRVADALTLTDPRRACEAWRGLTKDRGGENDFTVWYGLARCEYFDRIVLPDPHSPSGWRFHSSYQDATDALRRAFQILPAIHREFQTSWFLGLKRILRTQRTQLRRGVALRPDTGEFAAYASWSAAGDTLEYVPYRMRAFLEARGDVAAGSSAIAAEHQRHVFLDIAKTWRAAFLPNADALMAVAVALDELGDSTALDSLAAARRLADSTGDAPARLRVAAAEVWMLVKRSVPNDPQRLMTARAIADTLLRSANEHGADSLQALALASLAALTGHVHRGARLARGAEDLVRVPVRLQAAVRAFETYAALGAPVDSIRGLATLIWRTRDAATAATRSAWMRRAATVAFPVYHDSAIRELARGGDYLAVMENAWLVGDTATIRRRIATMRDVRRGSAPEDIKLEALYPEAWLLAEAGDPRAALDWIAPTLDAQQRSSIENLRSAVACGALVHAMVLRAQLASRLGRAAEAAQWARAVTALWADADDELQPIVREMSRLSK